MKHPDADEHSWTFSRVTRLETCETIIDVSTDSRLTTLDLVEQVERDKSSNANFDPSCPHVYQIG